MRQIHEFDDHEPTSPYDDDALVLDVLDEIQYADTTEDIAGVLRGIQYSTVEDLKLYKARILRHIGDTTGRIIEPELFDEIVDGFAVHRKLRNP